LLAPALQTSVKVVATLGSPVADVATSHQGLLPRLSLVVVVVVAAVVAAAAVVVVAAGAAVAAALASPTSRHPGRLAREGGVRLRPWTC